LKKGAGSYAERNEGRCRPAALLEKSRSAVRQARYLNTIVEQDHRTDKRVTQPMLGFCASFYKCSKSK
jgi:transposase-like protein